MRFTGERFILGQVTGDIETEHLQRYNMVRDVVKNKNVLDAACGEGYGSFILSKFAKFITGIDISQEAVEYAKSKYIRDNLEYRCASITKLPFENNTIDVVISFETIEHVDAVMQKQFLSEISRVLKPNGIMIMSSPDKLTYSDIPNYKNPYHVHELYVNQFKKLIEKYFKNVKLFYQGITKMKLGIIKDSNNSYPQVINILSEFPIEKKELRYAIAICSNDKMEEYLLRNLSSITCIDKEILSMLFIDTGNGIDGKNVIVNRTKKSIDNKYFVHFNLDKFTNSICSLRFDPIDNSGCICHILSMKSNCDKITIKISNADHSTENGDYFFTLDPQYFITDNVKCLKYIDIEYTLQELPIENWHQIILEKSKARLIEVQKLNNKLNNELNNIHSSKSFRLLHKCSSVWRKMINMFTK